MRRAVISIAAASAFLALSGIASAQTSSASPSTESVNPCPTGPSCAHCDSVTGEEKERCLRDQDSESSQPSEVPASSGGTSSTDSASPAASEEDSKAGAAPGGMSPD